MRTTETVVNEEYGIDFQSLMLSFMISDPQGFALSQNIIKPDYFDDKLRAAARFVLEYTNEYRQMPTAQQILAMANVNISAYPEAPTQRDWYLNSIEKFCKTRALEAAVLDGMDLIEKGRAGELEKRINEAMQISLIKDLGTSYFADPKARLERVNDRSNIVPTGWKSFDKKLEGGFTRGSLNIFAGGSGSGKSLFLQNLARKWALEGLNVVYISLELSEDLVNLRLDSMITNKGTAFVRTHIDDVALEIMMLSRKGVGDLKVKKFPEAGTTCNTIRAYLKEYEIQEGKKPDVLIIDYLDLMHPNSGKIDVSNLFTKDKYVSEEMRSIGTDWNIPVISASQLNRSSVEAQEFDHSHIAGGISKINTADNVFGIFTSISMRDRGVYQIQFLKTRSAASTGHKIELFYDTTSMLIEDMSTSEDENEIVKTRSIEDIKNTFKNNPTSSRLGGPPIIERREPVEGATVSQLAHPQYKTREEIATGKPAQSSPLRVGISDLIQRNRKTDE